MARPRQRAGGDYEVKAYLYMLWWQGFLIKAGYTVNIKKGKVVDGKGTTFINYEMEE